MNLKKIKTALLTFRALKESFFQQGVSGSTLLVVVVFILGMLFAFFISTPILWPLIYPLF